MHISLLIHTRQLFHWRKQYYGQKTSFNQKQWFEVKNDGFTVYLDVFITNMYLFTSQDVNSWIGVVEYLWIIVMLSWLSFWRHPFTAEHPLVSKWCNITFLQIFSDEEINSSIFCMAWGWVHFQQIFFFEWNVLLNSHHLERCLTLRVSFLILLNI